MPLAGSPQALVCLLRVHLAFVLACGGSGTSSPPPTGPTSPGHPDQYSIQITPPSATLVIGATITLAASVRNAAGTLINAAIQWTSSNSSIAVVDAQGVVSARAAGTCNITASSLNATSSVVVTVTPAAVGLRGTGLVYVGGRRIPFPGGPLNDEILAIDAQTGVETNLTLSQGSETYPMVSPDGQYVAFGQLILGTFTYSPWVAKKSGERIIDLAAASCSGFICVREWAWLADGRFEYVFDDGRAPAIRTLAPGNGTITSVSWPAALRGYSLLLSPAANLGVGYSGSGALVAVTFSDGRAVSIAPACRFSETCGQAFGWSPSSAILYAARDGTIAAIAVDGTSIRTLYNATSGELTEVAASPDGTMLAIIEGGRLRVIRLSDNSVAALTDADGQLAWSPDSRSIAYAAGSRVIAVNVDGTGSKTLATLPDFTKAMGISWGK